MRREVRDSVRTQPEARFFTLNDGQKGPADGSRGTLSLFLQQVSSDSCAGDSSEALYRLLERRVADPSFQTPFRLVRLQPGDSLRGLSSRPYFDTHSGERYVIHFTHPRPLLLRQMWPEISFALLLLAMVSAAFGAIYRSLRQQQRLTQIKNDFISNMTHELKTPITTVRVALEALQRFDGLADPQRSREYLDISSQELDRLTLLVDRVLKMSLFEREKMELRPEPLDLYALSSSIVATMQLQFQKYAATVHFESEGEGFQVQADRLHLSSVVFNLLDNALKYTPKQPQITVSLRRKGQQVHLSVQDNGVGIPQPYQEKVFEKFFRVPQGERHDVKGHGLGLSYVAEVLHQHGGTVTLDSEPGHGTTVHLILPAAPETGIHRG